jgi:hypothetical protein
MRSLRRKIAIALRACPSSTGLVSELRSSKGRLGRRDPPFTITAGNQTQAAPDRHEGWPKWSDALRAGRDHRETVSGVECVKARIATWIIIFYAYAAAQPSVMEMPLTECSLKWGAQAYRSGGLSISRPHATPRHQRSGCARQHARNLRPSSCA